MANLPEDPLLADAPSDDAGALTQARFRYQADCAARDCIRMLRKDGPTAIVCEWHEDYIVLYRDKPPELVSVKHRESSQGPWRIGTLITDGGLSHLLSRWLKFDRRPQTRLCTNAGLQPGATEAGALAAACESGAVERLQPFAERVAPPLSVGTSTARAFLSGLRIVSDLPKRKDIVAVQAVWLRTLLAELGLDKYDDTKYYERIVNLVLSASRDDPLPAEIVLENMNRPDAFSEQAGRDLRLAGRVIERDALMTLLRDPLPQAESAAAEATRMRLKLEAGGFGPTAVRRAQLLRAAWYAFARSQQDASTGELDAVRDWVHEQAELSEGNTSAEPPYGLRMVAELRDRIDAAADFKTTPELTRQLLLGCAFQMTDECQIWWSPEEVVPEA